MDISGVLNFFKIHRNHGSLSYSSANQALNPRLKILGAVALAVLAGVSLHYFFKRKDQNVGTGETSHQSGPSPSAALPLKWNQYKIKHAEEVDNVVPLELAGILQNQKKIMENLVFSTQPSHATHGVELHNQVPRSSFYELAGTGDSKNSTFLFPLQVQLQNRGKTSSVLGAVSVCRRSNLNEESPWLVGSSADIKDRIRVHYQIDKTAEQNRGSQKDPQYLFSVKLEVVKKIFSTINFSSFPPVLECSNSERA